MPTVNTGFSKTKYRHNSEIRKQSIHFLHIEELPSLGRIPLINSFPSKEGSGSSIPGKGLKIPHACLVDKKAKHKAEAIL